MRITQRKLVSLALAPLFAVAALAAQAADFIPPADTSNASIVLEHVLVDGESFSATLTALNSGQSLHPGQIYEIASLAEINSELPLDANFNSDDILLFVPQLKESSLLTHDVTFLLTQDNPIQLTVIRLESEYHNRQTDTVIHSGNVGPQGPEGPEGPRGPQGIEGQRGAAGPQGPSGRRGAAGPAGPAGATGTAGAAGPVGPVGPAGLDGAAGPAGLDGRTILSGTANPDGALGADGDFYINTLTSMLFGPRDAGNWPVGVALVGPSGLEGSMGPAGATGPEGPQGPAGPEGLPGPAGPDGYAGPQGSQGARGVPGLDGPQGPPGHAGPPGPPGATGPAGPAGGSTIIPFASGGTPLTLTTVAGGLVGTGGVVGFGHSDEVAMTGGAINAPLAGSFAFVMPRDGIITDVSAFAITTAAHSLIGSPLTIAAQVYVSTAPDPLFVPVAAVADLSPSLTGNVAVGTSLSGATNNLSIRVSAQSRVMLVFYVRGVGVAATVPVHVSGSIAIE